MSSDNGRYRRVPGSSPRFPRSYSSPPLSPLSPHLTSPPPPPTSTTPAEKREQRAREAMLVGELRKRFGLRGAEAFVRRYGLEAVNRAVADYDRVGEEGAEIRSPAGFIVWLVKEGACDGRG